MPLRSMAVTLLVVATICSVAAAQEDPDYLEIGELAAIGVGSFALFGAGKLLNQWDSTYPSRWTDPLPGERSVQRWLGGTYYPGKSNFLDGNFGSALTPIIGGIVVGATDLGWPTADRGKDFGQNLYIYGCGLLATKGLTSIAKGFVARPRPLLVLHPDLAATRTDPDDRYDRQSFFSGHASSAFFAMTYANKRARDSMRREMTADSYRDWRWLPPVLSYGWATFVGWSRIHSYKHFISDVAVGALAGWAMAELFYYLGDQSYRDPEFESQVPAMFTLAIPF